MSTLPTLILQMQRMGDIILSFPLFHWLGRTHPHSPLRVVAEPLFYDQLTKVSPSVFYLPWTEQEHIEARDYRLVLNLSHRPEAAALAGRVRARQRLGPVAEPDGCLRVLGDWQLYRAALTANNRHNRFHWAELNALDCVGLDLIGATRFDPPRDDAGDKPVGLFLGASEEAKRPDPAFWAQLAGELQRRGLKVVLLGGPDNTPLAREVRRLHGGTLADMCGQWTLRQFAAAGQTLSLLVTPDTGPMHLAAWTGLKVLNLSMGPVNPWETGPYQPGHYVLRADMACLDCWQCRFAHPRCRGRFQPGPVAYLAQKLARGAPARLAPPPGTRLYRTERTPEGLYMLAELGAGAARVSNHLGELWRGAFGMFFGLWGQERPRRSWQELESQHPRAARMFRAELAELAGLMRQAMTAPFEPQGGFWRAVSPMLRPLSGHMHMRLDNQDCTGPAWRGCLDMLEGLRGVVG